MRRTLLTLIGTAGAALAFGTSSPASAQYYAPGHHGDLYGYGWPSQHHSGFGYEHGDGYEQRYVPAHHGHIVLSVPHCQRVLVHTSHGHHWRTVCH